MKKTYYGVEKNRDLDPSLIKPDVRPPLHKLREFATEASTQIMFMIMLAAFGILSGNIVYANFISESQNDIPNLLFSYYWVDVLVVVGIAFFLYAKRTPAQFLFKEGLDVENGENWSPKKGLIYLGNDGDGTAINFAADDVKTHMLVMGSTGSGKSRFLLGILYQSLLIGSGCCYVDGKGDNTVWWLVYSFCRRVGREDDLLILNYLTGNEQPEDPSPFDHQLSNTTNPFSYGTADNLNSLIVGLMREAGGDGAMWKGRARTMLKGLLQALCYKRDKYGMLLDINIIREYFPLDKILALSKDTDLRSSARDPLKKYLLDLPGFSEDSAITGEISPKAYEQHNYLTMQLTEVMSDLSETYGKIFGVPLGEIDFKDVLFNRRILFCLLPSLEKDPDALEGLGKLVVAGLRSALAPALGSQVEGLKREVIDTKPTTSKVPFFIILDEYGYYAVQGFAVVAAQARSLGVSVIFAGQDIPSLKKASEEEAKATIANTNIKICMKLEDPDDTAKVFEMRAGEADVAKSEHHESSTFSYKKRNETRLQKEKLINVRDLVDQDPGEAHVMFRDVLSRCRFFYYEPHEVSEARLNKFIMIAKPKNSVIEKLKGATKKLDDLFLKDKSMPISPKTKDKGLKALLHDINWATQFNESPQSAALFALGMIDIRSELKDIDIAEKVDKKLNKKKANATPSPVTEEKDATPSVSLDKEDYDSDENKAKDFAQEIDNADDPLNELFDSFDELDDEELMKIFETAEENEENSMVEQAAEVSDEFAKMLNTSVENTLKNKGVPNEKVKNASEQLSDGESPEKAKRDLSLLGESSVYPVAPTPDKYDKETINQKLADILGQIESDKDKIK